MKKRVIIGAVAIGALTGAALWYCLKCKGSECEIADETEGAGETGKGGHEDESDPPEDEEDQPKNGNDVLAIQLRGKYIDETENGEEPSYCLVLDAPEGVKELKVSKKVYDSCSVGEVLLCRRADDGLHILI